MGRDLFLMPAFSEHTDFGRSSSHVILEVHRGENLFVRLYEYEKDAGIPVEEPVSCFLAEGPDGEYGYGYRKINPYGQTITYIKAGDLKEQFENIDTSEWYWKDRAVLAYINELPASLPVYFYWH